MVATIETVGTVAELLPHLRAAGLTHVISYGGPLPLDHWDPYGMSVCPGVNLRLGEEHHIYRGELLRLEDGSLCVRDHLTNPAGSPFVLGVWSFTRKEA